MLPETEPPVKKLKNEKVVQGAPGSQKEESGYEDFPHLVARLFLDQGQIGDVKHKGKGEQYGQENIHISIFSKYNRFLPMLIPFKT
ncbi:hypothetical protein [Flavobacterium selenitireducens]|uniref:hypothetical protein n=1 Tax=Flavobacterium selenitireducens TaxID=2722704 RepID=UPI00168C0AC0|nr:hypothetical protein [Flavobacterium selenitireducens]MBD3580969.1 hypothetical protein [Flavobacterium selenitireducens]